MHTSKRKVINSADLHRDCDYKLDILSAGTFKSAALIIKDDLTNEQKEKLVTHVVDAFKEFQAQDLAMLIPLLMTNAPFQNIIVGKIIHFLTSEMKMQIID